MLETFITVQFTKEVDNDQSDLLVENLNFRKRVKPKYLERRKKKNQKEDVLETYIIFSKVQKEFLMLLIAKIFPIKIEGTSFLRKVSDHSNPKILTLKQMLQRLPIVLAQVKVGNTSKTLPNEIILCIQQNGSP